MAKGKKQNLIPKKNHHIWRNFFAIAKIFGGFLAFFFWNHHIQLMGSSGSSTCNEIPRFSSSLFVL